MTSDGTIDQTGLAAIQLRNAGTATVNLWAGSMYTLDSKETLSLNVTEAGGVLDFEKVQVAFDTSSGATKSLQILLLKYIDC